MTYQRLDWKWAQAEAIVSFRWTEQTNQLNAHEELKYLVFLGSGRQMVLPANSASKSLSGNSVCGWGFFLSLWYAALHLRVGKRLNIQPEVVPGVYSSSPSIEMQCFATKSWIGNEDWIFERFSTRIFQRVSKTWHKVRRQAKEEKNWWWRGKAEVRRINCHFGTFFRNKARSLGGSKKWTINLQSRCSSWVLLGLSLGWVNGSPPLASHLVFYHCS